MKKLLLSLSPLLILIFVYAFRSESEEHNCYSTFLAEKDTIIYKDGTFTGRSRSIYTEEPYWGEAVIRMAKGKITKVSFTITDTAKNEPFNEAYKKYFKGNDEYVQQCINDAKGVKEYPKKLTKSQDIHRVDATSGATWSYNIFKASVDEALKKAVR